MTDNETTKKNAADYIVTTTSNYVSKQAHLEHPNTIELQGQTIIERNVRLQGPLKVSRYCAIGESTSIEPPLAQGKQIAIAIGSKTHIGKDCTIRAAAIGSFCWIGDSVTIGERCILKDCVVVANGCNLPPDTVIPPFSYVKGSGVVRVELPPSTPTEWEEVVMDHYHTFVAEINASH